MENLPKHFQCDQCGLKYSTSDELKNHQLKFCLNSHYADQTTLDTRLKGLSGEFSLESPHIHKIRSNNYQNFEQLADDPTNYRNIDNTFSPSPTKKGKTLEEGKILDEFDNLKGQREDFMKSKIALDQDVMLLLRDLENRKEREIRAENEKEDILRTINEMDRRALSEMERQKKQELQYLAKDREQVRIKENMLLEDVKQLENFILDQERLIQSEKNQLTNPKDLEATINFQKQEEVWANERAKKVAKIKAERDKLEVDRQRIMVELDKLKGGGQSGISMRKNNSAVKIANQILGNNPASGYGDRMVGFRLDGQTKDSLVRNQVRINDLRAAKQLDQDQHQIDMKDMDILEREFRVKQNKDDSIDFYHNLNNYQNQIGQSPYKSHQMEYLAERTYQDAAVPRTANKKKDQSVNHFLPPKPSLGSQNTLSQQNRQPQPVPINDKLDELERLLTKPLQSQPTQLNPIQQNSVPFQPHPLHLNPIAYNSVPLMQHPSQLNPVTYNSVALPHPGYGGINLTNQPAAPPSHLPYGYDYLHQQQSLMRQPTIQPMPVQQQMSNQQRSDPAMEQLASILKQQSDDNQKLMDALGNLAKNTSSVNELENKVTITNHRLQSVAGSRQDDGAILPDEFVFRQNDTRSADLDEEERALINLAQMEYDQLRVLQKLPKGSELYQLKLKQFKELSAMRVEMEKVLQEQRIEKLRKNFEKQKVEDQRQIQQQHWIDNQKKIILSSKLSQEVQGFASILPEQDYDHPRPMSNHNFHENIETPIDDDQFRPKSNHQFEREDFKQNDMLQSLQNQVQQNPEIKKEDQLSIDLQFDGVFCLPKQIKDIQVRFRPYNGLTVVGESMEVGPIASETDHLFNSLNKIMFKNHKNQLNGLPIKKSLRILFKILTTDLATSKLVGAGWTWIDLYPEQDGKLAEGLWALPIYAGDRSPDIAMRGSKNLKSFPGVSLCIRVGKQGSQIMYQQSGPDSHTKDYTVPNYHQKIVSPVVEVQKPTQVSEFKKDPTYENIGFIVKLHYLVQRKNLEKLRIRSSVFRLVSQNQVVQPELLNDSQGKQLQNVMPTLGADKSMQMGVGQWLNMDPSGQIKIINLDKPYYTFTLFTRPLDNYQIEFMVPFYNLFWENQYPIILIFEIFDNKEPQSYAVIDICKDNGKIVYGQYQLPLSKDMIKFKQEDRVPIEGEFIGFTLVNPLEIQKKNPFKPNEISVEEQKQRSPESQKQNERSPKNQKFDSTLYSEQFIPNNNVYFTDQVYAAGEPIDIYLDGFRHLPDNITVTKAIMKVVDINLKEIKPVESVVVLNESTLRNHIFRSKMEIRMTSKPSPTSLLIINLCSVDNSNNKPCLVGTVSFPLFLDKNSQEPPTSNSNDSTIALYGAYQLPLYYGNYQEVSPFGYEKLLYKWRVPTASALVRIVRGPLDAKGKPLSLSTSQDPRLSIPPPLYKEGVYNNEFFNLAQDETNIMVLRRSRPNPPLNQITVQNQSMNQQTFEKLLGSIDLKKALSLEPINLDFHSQYEPQVGFRVQVEALHNNTKKSYFGILCSQIQNSLVYQPGRQDLPKGVFKFLNTDFSLSKHQNILFNDSEAIITGIPPTDKGLSIIFDIREFDPKTLKFIPYGYAVCPVLTQLENGGSNKEWYVQSGVFSLPVIKGQPNLDLIKYLQQFKDPSVEIPKMVAASQIGYLETVSLVIKLIDSQRKLHFNKPIHLEPPSLRYVETKKQGVYTYKKDIGGVSLGEYLPSQFNNDIGPLKKLMHDQFKLAFKNL